MIKEKYILAAGSPAFSKGLAEIFRGEGWQADTVANKAASVRCSQEMHDVPQYFVTDKLKDWVTSLARKLQPQGTVIILSGFMPEAPEELERAGRPDGKGDPGHFLLHRKPGGKRVLCGAAGA